MRDRMNVYFPPQMLKEITELAERREKAVKISANVLTNIPNLNLNWQKAYANVQSVRTAQKDAGVIESQLSVERLLEAADNEEFQNASGRLLDFEGLVDSMQAVWARIQAASDVAEIASLDTVLGIESEKLAGMEAQFSLIYQAHASDPRFTALAQSLDQLKKQGIRVELNDKNEPLNARIRDAEMQKIPYILVVGDREAEQNTVSVRSRSQKGQNVVPVSEFVEKIKSEIFNKALA